MGAFISTLNPFDFAASSVVFPYTAIRVLFCSKSGKFLNKDSIFTITTAALQEIDTQLQNEKQRKENLKTRLKTLEEMF